MKRAAAVLCAAASLFFSACSGTGDTASPAAETSGDAISLKSAEALQPDSVPNPKESTEETSQISESGEVSPEPQSMPELEIYEVTPDGDVIVTCTGYALDFNNDGFVSCADYEISGYSQDEFVEELLSVYHLADENEAQKLLDGEISIACGVSTGPADVVESSAPETCGYPLAPEAD